MHICSFSAANLFSPSLLSCAPGAGSDRYPTTASDTHVIAMSQYWELDTVMGDANGLPPSFNPETDTEMADASEGSETHRPTIPEAVEALIGTKTVRPNISPATLSSLAGQLVSRDSQARSSGKLVEALSFLMKRLFNDAAQEAGLLISAADSALFNNPYALKTSFQVARVSSSQSRSRVRWVDTTGLTLDLRAKAFLAHTAHFVLNKGQHMDASAETDIMKHIGTDLQQIRQNWPAASRPPIKRWSAFNDWKVSSNVEVFVDEGGGATTSQQIEGSTLRYDLALSHQPNLATEVTRSFESMQI